MKLTINSYYHFLLFIIISTIFLTSCETNNIIIKPDLTSNVFSNNELIRTGVKIVRVYDKRLGRQVLLPEDVGWVHDGVNDKEFPVLFDDYVLTFVEDSINKMICADTSATDFVPVIVTIDTFKVYETLNQHGKTSTFKASMNFEFPLSNDSTLIISTNTIQKIKTDSGVTVLIENLIYAGIREC